MNMRRFLMVAVVIFFAVGCGDDADGGGDGSGWEFCDESPECPTGYVERGGEDECPDSAYCEEITKCGKTIVCEEPALCQAVATCDPVTEVEFHNSEHCPGGDEVCQRRTECATEVWCWQPEAICDGPLPECPQGAKQVDRWWDCAHEEGECYPVHDTDCGQVSWCWEAEGVCDGPPPECPQGAQQVDGPGDCPQGDVSCFSVEDEECGQETWCYEEVEQCLAMPVCPPGSEEGECPGPEYNCWEETLCGVTIECYEEAVICDGLPVCPEGTKEVESCPEDEDVDCYAETMCGVTIYCVDEAP